MVIIAAPEVVVFRPYVTGPDSALSIVLDLLHEYILAYMPRDAPY